MKFGFRISDFGFFLVWAVLLAVWLAPAPARAASAAERRAFATAATLFNDRHWELAERELAEFVRRYPDSERRAEAVLLQAQARFQQKNLAGVVELLQAQRGAAGPLADEYQFWIAEAHFQSQQYAAAAAAYAQLLRDFPKSKRRLDACQGEAFCRFKLLEYPRVKELLGNPAGDFQQLTKDRPNDPKTVDGYLLLAETLLLTKEFRAGEQAVERLKPDKLKPEQAWRRQYALCRLQLADNRPQAALVTATNLMLYAQAAQQKALIAESVILLAGIYEQLQQLDQAAATYEKNLSEIASPEQRRQALLKVIELTLGQNQVAAAIAKLEAFTAQMPNDPAQDLAQLTLGELKLKQYVARVESGGAQTNAPPGGTNLVQAALAHFDRVVTDFAQSPLAGKAYLHRGWCHWLLGNIENSQPSFRLAVERLPVSLDQACARFKLGDTYIWQKDYTNALTQFSLVISNYTALPGVKEALFDQALYQILRASIAISNLAAANDAFQKLITWYPESYYSDRSMLLLGQALNSVRQPAEARKIFTDLVRQFPHSPLVPEAQLAMARTYVQEGLWEEAIAKYNAWAANTAARRQLPAAEFDRAWVHYRAGQETNALQLFTRFVADFPADTNAPRAQFWVASYYFRSGDWTNAEANFQLLFQNTNWPATPLTYESRLMAGRAALARQSYKDATNYITEVINDEKCPTNILLEALFAYADTLIEMPSFEAAKTLEKFTAAITTLRKISQIAPASPLLPAAEGRIGDCYLQLAALDAKYYENAAESYRKAMTDSRNVSVRSQAEVGLGLVFEKQAALAPPAQRPILLAQAFEHYHRVFYGLNLAEQETADPFWLKKSALAAASLKEAQLDYPAAIVLYERLKSQLPALRELCDRKIKAAREHQRETQKP